MKTISIKLICFIFSAVFLLSSCLGDGDGYVEITKDFAYIHNEKGLQYAYTSSGYPIYHDEINKLKAGECYTLSYKISGSVNSNGLYVADNVVVDEDGPFNKYMMRAIKPYSDIDLDTQNDSIHVTSFEPQYRSSSKIPYNDNWLFQYSAKNRKGDHVRPYFYFDENNQVDENGDEIGWDQGKIIIDVRFINIEATGEGSDMNQNYYSVCDFSNLRNRTVDFKGDNYVNVYIKFRYYAYDGSNELKPYYKGSWYTGSSSSYNYFLTFQKETTN